MLRRLANRAIFAGKQFAHRGTDYLASKVHSKIDEFPMIEGSGMRRKKGRGLAGMALSGGGELANLIGGPGSREASAVLKSLGGAANIFGLGMKPKKRKIASAAQLAALAKGRAVRDANRYGGALRAAGY